MVTTPPSHLVNSLPAHPRIAHEIRPLLEVRVLSRRTSVLQLLALARSECIRITGFLAFCDAEALTASRDVR